jgi:hypothetical protein
MTKQDSNKENNTKGKIYISPNIHIEKADLEKEYYRADLRLLGVNIKVPSYEGRVFLNNTSANCDTQTDLEHGYVGSYNVFGHPNCLGDVGHCDDRPRRFKFDVIPYRLAPEDIAITITDKLKSISRKTEDFVVTICPIVSTPIQVEGMAEVDVQDVVKLDKVSIEIYDKEAY